MLSPSHVPIHWRAQPFTGEVLCARRPEGMSVLEIVRSVPDLPALFDTDGVVMINGVVVPRESWAFVRPRVRKDKEVVVTLHVQVRGGGGGGSGERKNPIATIAMIALLIVTVAVTGGLLGPAGLGIAGGLFAAGSLSATLLAAGIGIAGQLAIAALTPPPIRNTENPSGGDDSGVGAAEDGRSAASIDGNVLARGAPVPRVVGTHKVYPTLACSPLVELVGLDEYVEGLYILNGPHAFSDIKLGDTAIDDIDDIEYEISEGLPGDPNTTLITRQSFSESPQLALSRHVINVTTPTTLADQVNPSRSVPTWHPLATRDTPDEVWMVLAFQEGLIDFASPTTNIGIPLRLQIRKRGEAEWKNLPEIHFSSKNGLAFQKVIKFKWELQPFVQALAPSDEGPYLAIKTVPPQTIDPPSSGWNAHAYFSGGSGSSVYSASTYQANLVRNLSLNQDGVEVFLDPDVFTPGVYEINLRLGTAYNVSSFTPSTYTYAGSVYDFFEYFISSLVATLPRTRAQIHDKCTVTRITSVWREPPIAAGNWAQIAVRAKNRSIGRLSAIASGYVRDWNGTDWGAYTITDNPAPHLVDAMTGALNADPLPGALVDNATIVAWRQACIDNGYTINSVIEGGTVEDARRLICASGWARPSQSETWGLIRDKDRTGETPVQIFSPRNLSGFRWEKAFPKLPDGFRVIFNNRAINYEEDELIVIRDGVFPEAADRIEEMRYASFVDAADALARAEFDLKQLSLRSTFYYGNADIESIVCRRGDLVGVQHDTIAHWAGSARIKSVTRGGGSPEEVVSITLDGSIPAPGSRFIVPNDGQNVLLAGPGSLLLVGENTLLQTQPDQPFLDPRTFLEGRKFGAAIRRSDGTIITAELTSVDEDEVKEITFSTPIADPANLIREDCLITTGILGQEYRRLIVLDIRPGKDLTADLTFVDEAPGLWS